MQDRTAIVTGGASGIGRATALALSKAGVRVVVGDYDPMEENESLFKEAGIKAVKMDVRSEEDVKRLFEMTEKVDYLVNCAGVGLDKQIPECSEQEWDHVFDINVKGAFLMSKHAIPKMKLAGGGCIVNVSSNAGILPRAHDPVYSTSKGSLQAFTHSLALCHAPDRIRVNAVCPGPVCDTRIMNPDIEKFGAERYISASPLAAALGRMITPDEVAASIMFLLSDAAQMVTGTSIAIDGGKSLGVPPKN